MQILKMGFVCPVEHLRSNTIWPAAIWVVRQEARTHPVEQGVIAHLVWDGVIAHYTRQRGCIMGILCKRGEAIAPPLNRAPSRYT